MQADGPAPKEPRFKNGDFVEHEGKPWEVQGLVGGDLQGFLYPLRGLGGKTKNAREEELEPWRERTLAPPTLS